jgi:hypothetical protein
VLPLWQQRHEIEKMKSTWAPFSYYSVRQKTPDILNVKQGYFDDGHKTPWHIIERDIKKLAKSPDAIKANLGVAQALYDFADAHEISGLKQEFAPWMVTYWYPASIVIDGKPTVPFIDPRRSGLSTASYRFIFSVMHERIRVAYSDFERVRLGIIRFCVKADGSRRASITTEENRDLLDFETLENMISTTYSLWEEIHQQRRAARRHQGRG